MSRLYVVDDDESTRVLLTAYLEQAGHEVKALESGAALLKEERLRPADLVVLDVMMPGMDGFQTLVAYRVLSKAPVVFLTGRDAEPDYCAGLALGADDYMAKPVRPAMLVAKVSALLRRQRDEQGHGRLASVPQCGNLRFDESSHAFLVEDVPMRLTPTEERLLLFFMARFEGAVSREEVLREVWGLPDGVESRVVDETNRRVRRKLAAANADVSIQTIWGYGFRLALL